MKTNAFIEAEKARQIRNNDENAFADFLVNKGLYETIIITPENIWDLANLAGGGIKVDVFCPKCGEKRIFISEPIYRHLVTGNEGNYHSVQDEIVNLQQTLNRQRAVGTDINDSWIWTTKNFAYDTRIMAFRFYCAKDHSHRMDYIVSTEDNIMRKIGQYPSIADLSFPELKEYRKVMTSKEDEKELKRAIGLYANGIGVGSFVYLRRIFERIINNACEKAINDNKYNEKELMDLQVKDRIKKLSGYLPKAVVDSTVAYGIMSKGIHEFSEEECKEYFPVLQAFIMMVLRQWEAIRKEAEDAENLQKELNRIASNI